MRHESADKMLNSVAMISPMANLLLRKTMLSKFSCVLIFAQMQSVATETRKNVLRSKSALLAVASDAKERKKSITLIVNATMSRSIFNFLAAL